MYHQPSAHTVRHMMSNDDMTGVVDGVLNVDIGIR